MKVYEYQNYRQFLEAAIEERRRNSRGFSLRAFAQRAGFASHTYLPKVIAGERNLTADSAPRVAKALGLQSSEERFFCAMVDYNQCQDEEERNRLYRELMGIYGARNKQALDQKHAQYYEHWYYPIIRHLVVYAPWHGDYSVLASLVSPPIQAREAKQAVKVLQECGLLVYISDNKWELSSTTVNVDQLPLVSRSKGRRDILLRGIDSIERFTPEERFTYCALLSMGKTEYHKVVEILRNAGRSTLEVASGEADVDRVYQVALQIFPSSDSWKPS